MSKKNYFLTTIYPWVVWVLAASFFYYKYLIQVSPGVMSAELMSAYSLTGAGLGNLAACFFYGYLLMQIPVGLLLDRFSPGKITAIALLTCALGIFLFAHSVSLVTACLSRFLIGLSASFAAVSCFKLTSIWFPPKRFAFVAGLSMTAAMLGAIGGQAPLSLLVNQFGWRHALEFIAILGFILSFFIWLIIKDRQEITPCHLTAKTDEMPFMSKLRALLKHKQTWLLSIYSGLAFAPVSVFGGLWGVSFLEEAYALDVSRSAHYISIIFIGFAIGCPLTGWLSDYIGQRKIIMALGTILALMSLSIVVYLPIPLSLLSFSLFLFGIGASCFFLCFSMIRELHSLIFTGTVLGFMNTFDSICEAVTEPLIGKLLDFNWTGTYKHGARAFSLHDYHHSLLALSIYFIIALVLLLFIKETDDKKAHR
jgi:sugar phosphate permease